MQIGPYLPLFDFEVEHTFFPDSRCANALRFALTPVSAALLHRSCTFARPTDAGVAVLADCSRLEALRMIAKDADEPFRLTWLAYAADPLFGNYTEGLVYPPEGLLVFDSESAVADRTTGRWHLQRKAYVSATDALALSSETVVQVLSGKAPHVPPLFVVKLHLAATATEFPPEPKRYVLRFATRAAVWRYWLIGDWRESQPQVVDPDGQAAFLQAKEATLPDGSPALTIQSTAPIGIFRRSPFRFQLRGRAGSGERLLVKRLPVAGSAQLIRDPCALGGSLVSEIYIHR
jgi:hypothetical protein